MKWHQSELIFNNDNFHALCDLLAAKESIFHTIIKAYGYPPFWSRQPSFETLIHVILEQQVSLASALAAYNKLKEKVPVITPEHLLTLTDKDLKACYFSRQKIAYAKHLATAIVSGDLIIENLQLLSNEKVAQQLQKVKGIGHWTSDVYLMMSLHRSDRFPVGDVALVKSMKKQLQLPMDTSKQTLLEIAENWRPYRSIAAYCLWHVYLSERVP
jgi:DNA-3-methyladenine glycosylase II